MKINQSPRKHFLNLMLLLFFVNNAVAKHNCSESVRQLAHMHGTFLDCVIHHFIPMEYCGFCQDIFHDVEKAYEVLTSNETCKQIYLEGDPLNVIETSQSFMSGLWTKAFCHHYPSSNESEKFENYISDHENCLNTHTLNDTCNGCFITYNTLNTFYINLEKEYDGDICFDLQDKMNRTRLHWSKELGCCQRIFNKTFFVLTTGFIGLLTIIFYAGIYFYTKSRERNHDMLTDQDVVTRRCPAPPYAGAQ